MFDEIIILKYNLQFFAESDAGEKTEAATPKKLDEARTEGQVAKSTELVNSVMLIAFFVILKLTMTYIGTGLINTFSSTYNQISTLAYAGSVDVTYNAVASLTKQAITSILLILVPMFITGFSVAFIGNFIQVKWKISLKPIMPKFSKLNPINGFKRIFSMQSIMNLFKSVALIIIIGYISIKALNDSYNLIMNILDYTFEVALIKIGTLVLNLSIKISAVYLAVGFIDFVYQRLKFSKDMRMTKREIKDEMKNSEGDPLIKGQIRRKMREASQRRMMKSLPEADVVITNPTHFAVAIKYDLNKASAPYVLAKGEDFLALKIKEMAKEYKVEVVENKPLARALYHNVDIGQEIPAELYQAVAEVLAFVYSVKGKK